MCLMVEKGAVGFGIKEKESCFLGGLDHLHIRKSTGVLQNQDGKFFLVSRVTFFTMLFVLDLCRDYGKPVQGGEFYLGFMRSL